MFTRLSNIRSPIATKPRQFIFTEPPKIHPLPTIQTNRGRISKLTLIMAVSFSPICLICRCLRILQKTMRPRMRAMRAMEAMTIAAMPPAVMLLQFCSSSTQSPQSFQSSHTRCSAMQRREPNVSQANSSLEQGTGNHITMSLKSGHGPRHYQHSYLSKSKKFVKQLYILPKGKWVSRCVCVWFSVRLSCMKFVCVFFPPWPLLS